MDKVTKAKKTQPKFAKERTVFVENHFGQLCQTFGSITRKVARLRNKGDVLAKQLTKYASADEFSHSSTSNLKEFAKNLAAIQDYRHAEIGRLEKKVVKPLSEYGDKCKKVKTAVSKEEKAIKKVQKEKKQLVKVRQKSPSDEHSISQAEADVQKATSDEVIDHRNLKNQILLFEKKKIGDLKKILTDFVSVEMVFHAKAIEYYSQCYENLARIDEDLDLEEFERHLESIQPQAVAPTAPAQGQLPPEATMSTLGTTGLSTTLGSTSEYTSTGDSYTFPYGESSANADKRVRIQTSQGMYAAADDDDEESDYDEESEDEDEIDNSYTPRR